MQEREYHVEVLGKNSDLRDVNKNTGSELEALRQMELIQLKEKRSLARIHQSMGSGEIREGVCGGL